MAEERPRSCGGGGGGGEGGGGGGGGGASGARFSSDIAGWLSEALLFFYLSENGRAKRAREREREVAVKGEVEGGGVGRGRGGGGGLKSEIWIAWKRRKMRKSIESAAFHPPWSQSESTKWLTFFQYPAHWIIQVNGGSIQVAALHWMHFGIFVLENISGIF